MGLITYKRVDLPTDKKFRFEGFCPKCNKITSHRYAGGSLYEDRYRCMKCKSINIVDSNFNT